MKRGPLIIVVAAALTLLLIALGVGLVRHSQGDRVAFTRPDAGPYRGSEPAGRNPMPDFRLRGYRGNVVTSDGLAGRVVVLTFLDSHCTDACPIIASVVARTMERLTANERRSVKAIGITTDPVHDTPHTVERFLRRQHAEDDLDYLLGTKDELEALWDKFYVLSSLETGNPQIHSAPVRIYARDAVWAATLHTGADLSEANLLHDIRVALRGGSD